MKKYLVILLAMLLVLVAIPAMADSTASQKVSGPVETYAAGETIEYDYGTPYLVQGGKVVSFKSTKAIKYDAASQTATYEFKDFEVKQVVAEYPTEVKTAEKDSKWKIVEERSCEKDATIALYPLRKTSATASTVVSQALLVTNNPDDKSTEKLTDYEYKTFGEARVVYYLYSPTANTMTGTKFVENYLKGATDAEKKALLKSGHSYVGGQVLVVTEPTCTEKGQVIKICDNCQTPSTALETEAYGHKSPLDKTAEKNLIASTTGTYKVGNKTYKLVTAPDCKNKGSYTGPCSVCGKDATFELAKDATAHKFGKWNVEVASTCVDSGLEYRLCTICYAAKERRISDPLGHDFKVSPTKAATCMTEGEAKEVTCSRCKLKVTADKAAEFVITVGGKTLEKAAEDKVKEQLSEEKIGKTVEKILLPIDKTNHPKEYWIEATQEKTLEDGKTVVKSKAPTCEAEGKSVYVCGLCGGVASEVKLDKLAHNMVTVYFIDDGNGNKTYEKTLTCKENPTTGKPYKQYEANFCANAMMNYYPATKKADDTLDPTKVTYAMVTAIKAKAANTSNKVCKEEVTLKEVKAPEHDWGEWIERNKPDAETPGYWVRICKVCKQQDELISDDGPKSTETVIVPSEEKTTETKSEEKSEETKSEEKSEETKSEEKTEETKSEEKTEETKSEEKSEEKKNGIVKDEDNKYRVYKDGKVDETETGIVEYDGAKFFCTKGVLDTDYNGLALYDGTWYFLAAGKITAPTHPDGVVSYDGAYFKVKEDGTVDTSATGVYDFDGGKFAFSDGQINTSVNGLYYDPISKEFVFCANGQVQTQFSGVAEYDGYFFVLKDGKLDDKDGTITYGGVEFDVVKGQLFPKAAPAEETPAVEAPAEETPVAETEAAA